MEVNSSVVIIIGLRLMVSDSGLVNSKLIVNIVVEMDSEILLFAGVKLNFCESIGRIGCI